MEELEGGSRGNVHCFGKSDACQINSEMAACVCHGHMRMLLPTCAKTQGDWAHCQPNIRNVSKYGWIGWADVSDGDGSLPTVHALGPGAFCGVETCITSQKCPNPIGGDASDALDPSDMSRWGKWIHWAPQQPVVPMSRPMPFPTRV